MWSTFINYFGYSIVWPNLTVLYLVAIFIKFIFYKNHLEIETLVLIKMVYF